jgi:16S rRNA G966 N2-methylase RsmD
LDFSLRSKKVTLPGSRGYALTSKKALKNMLKGISLEGKAFLDIGSGKGGVIYYAYQLGCKVAVGIEYEKALHDIAEKNIEKLGLKDYCKSINIDARDFDQYADFDIYFLFNPFDYDIYEEVINKIVAQNKAASNTKEKYLICYGDANIKAVLNSGYFELIREGVCPYRGNVFRVFKTIVK